MTAMAVYKSSLLVYIIGLYLLKWTHCSCTDLLTHVLNCRLTYTLIQTMGLQPFYGKGWHRVLRDSSLASHGPVTVSGMPDGLNQCLICVYTYVIYKLAAGRIILACGPHADRGVETYDSNTSRPVWNEDQSFPPTASCYYCLRATISLHHLLFYIK